MQAFVLDLRNNPGGLIDSAVGVCGEFLPPGTVVVTTEGRICLQNPPPYRTPARSGKAMRKYPMCVLINHLAAPAAPNWWRRPPGPQARHHRRHHQFRQRFRADRAAHEERGRHAPDHGQILHTRPPHDPRERCGAQHRLGADER